MKTFLNLYKIIMISSFLLITIILYSCHKEGTGGKSSVNGTVYHHSKPIANAVVYIKYGAIEFPGTDLTVYDNHVTADANAHYEFTGLNKGNYFLYAVGYDNSIFKDVKGGVGIKVSNKKTVASDIPVTED